jgi:hypothetical protein
MSKTDRIIKKIKGASLPELVVVARDPEGLGAMVVVAKKLQKNKTEAAAADAAVPDDVCAEDAKDEEDAERKTKRMIVRELFADIRMETQDDSIAGMIAVTDAAFKATRDSTLFDSATLEDKIMFYAGSLKKSSALVAYNWMKLTQVASEFFDRIMKSHHEKRKLLTVVKKHEEYDATYEDLLSCWTKVNLCGYALLTVVRMIPVGKLIREFNRLVFYSAPTCICGHEEALREMFSKNDGTFQYWRKPMPIMLDFDGTTLSGHATGALQMLKRPRETTGVPTAQDPSAPTAPAATKQRTDEGSAMAAPVLIAVPATIPASTTDEHGKQLAEMKVVDMTN